MRCMKKLQQFPVLVMLLFAESNYFYAHQNDLNTSTKTAEPGNKSKKGDDANGPGLSTNQANTERSTQGGKKQKGDDANGPGLSTNKAPSHGSKSRKEGDDANGPGLSTSQANTERSTRGGKKQKKGDDANGPGLSTNKAPSHGSKSRKDSQQER
jgi:hypothetical protein